MTNNNLFDTLVVVKRSGQRTSFQGEKIAIAIQKAFDSLDIPYKDEDVNKIYSKVLKKIEKEYTNRKTINIENIQDIIELILKEEKFTDVYEAFKNYREKRNTSRKTFVIKQQHKFLKALELLGLENINKESQEESTLIHFGKIISSEFAKAYLLDSKIVRFQESGSIYLDSLETMTTGEIDSLEISLIDLFENNKEIREKLMEKNTILDFLSNLKILLYNLSKEIYGSICLGTFDKDLEEITLNNYKKVLKNNLNIYLKTSGIANFINKDELDEEINNITSLEDEIFSNYYKSSQELKSNFELIRKQALLDTEKLLIDNLNIFFNELIFTNISINFGSSTTLLGQLIIESIIKASIDSKNINYYFKVKDKINKKEKDPNFNLLEKYKLKNLERNNFNYAFLDTSFNNLKDEEVCYFHDGERVIEDETTALKKLTSGKGNITSCAINITRIALKNSYLTNKTSNIRKFYQDLDNLINIAKEALLTRFEIDCKTKNTNFPYLYKNGLWYDGDKLKENDRLRKLLKHGNLTINFCGLKETVYALEKDINKHQEIAKDILKYMNKKIEKLNEDNNLNFVLSTTIKEEISKEFKKQDTAIYGKLKNITDKVSYSNANDYSENLKDISFLHKKCRGGAIYKTKIKTKKELDNLILEASNNGLGAIKVSKL